MIETAINIGYVVIVALITAILYYTIRIADIRYNFLDRLKREETEEKITWNQK